MYELFVYIYFKSDFLNYFLNTIKAINLFIQLLSKVTYFGINRELGTKSAGI